MSPFDVANEGTGFPLRPGLRRSKSLGHSGSSRFAQRSVRQRICADQSGKWARSCNLKWTRSGERARPAVSGPGAASGLGAKAPLLLRARSCGQEKGRKVCLTQPSPARPGPSRGRPPAHLLHLIRVTRALTGPSQRPRLRC